MLKIILRYFIQYQNHKEKENLLVLPDIFVILSTRILKEFALRLIEGYR